VKPLVIQTEHLDEEAGAWLRERCRVEVCSSDDAKFEGLLREADALLIRTYTQVNAEMLAKAPKLKVVARAGVGLDNVDIAACTKRGVRVVSTPGANTRAVVELVFAMVLDVLRPRLYLDAPLDGTRWKELRKELQAPRQLAGMTLGILGLGKVGSAMARIGAAFDMRVVYHDVREIPAAQRAGAEPVAREELFRRADMLSLHVDGRAANKLIIGARELAMCKSDVVLVNTSRGFVMDNAALRAFLLANPGATALLDVHEPEPIAADYPLLGLANARITPHIGAATAAANRNMSWVVRDLWRVLSGEEPEWGAD
jgi:phosphoglycerate dehydrogenase-like enzyme